MPKFLRPQKISAHRIAAIAIYRALLTQARRTTLPQGRKTELQNLIRYRFKQWRLEQDAKKLRVAFRGAYEALDKLDEAVAGDNESAEYVNGILDRVGDKYKQPWPRRPVKTKLLPTSNTSQPSILSRPRPLSELSGRRHVPRLINAAGFPVLRIKKPQPSSLSAYITRRQHKRQMRTNLRHELHQQASLYDAEDQWDNIIGGIQAGQSRTSQEPSWKDALRRAERKVQDHIDVEQHKAAEMAQKMQDIVDAERLMFKQEGRRRRRAAVRAKAEGDGREPIDGV